MRQLTNCLWRRCACLSGSGIQPWAVDQNRPFGQAHQQRELIHAQGHAGLAWENHAPRPLMTYIWRVVICAPAQPIIRDHLASICSCNVRVSSSNSTFPGQDYAR